MTTVGVDLGGTNLLVALVDDDHRIRASTRVTTPQEGPDAVIDAIADAVTGLGGEPTAVGVGAPGPISDGVVRVAPNLAGWTEPVPLAERLAAKLGTTVLVDNDVNVGVVGEWVAGAGRGARFLLGVWLGTGVGGGLVLDGKPYRGAYGAAAELGHVIVQAGGALCGCGRRGCVEAYAGRANMEQVVAQRVAKGWQTSVPQIMAKAGKDRMTSKVWAKALKADDPVAVAVFDEAVDALGVAIGSAINLLDLDRVVIGGGLAEKLGADLAERLAAAARPWTMVADVDRRFVVAEHGDDAGVIGAAHLARVGL